MGWYFQHPAVYRPPYGELAVLGMVAQVVCGVPGYYPYWTSAKGVAASCGPVVVSAPDRASHSGSTQALSFDYLRLLFQGTVTSPIIPHCDRTSKTSSRKNGLRLVSSFGGTRIEPRPNTPANTHAREDNGDDDGSTVLTKRRETILDPLKISRFLFRFVSRHVYSIRVTGTKSSKLSTLEQRDLFDPSGFGIPEGQR